MYYLGLFIIVAREPIHTSSSQERKIFAKIRAVSQNPRTDQELDVHSTLVPGPEEPLGPLLPSLVSLFGQSALFVSYTWIDSLCSSPAPEFDV